MIIANISKTTPTVINIHCIISNFDITCSKTPASTKVIPKKSIKKGWFTNLFIIKFLKYYLH